MRISTAACALLLLGAAATAQPIQPSAEIQRIDQLEQRIQDLERQLRSATTQPSPSPLTGSAPSPPAGPPDARAADATEAALGLLDSPAAPPTPDRKPALTLPDIAVIGDFVASGSTDRDNDALNRADIREVEFDVRSSLGPWADGVVVVAVERDVENPVFPGDEPAEGPETSVSIEEAYVLLHDFGIDRLTATIGRFYLTFGRQNRLHLHNLPTVDPSLANQAFLSPESLGDAGGRVSYVLPPDLVGDQYVETILEVVSGEGASSESPTLSGDLTVDSPATNLHVLWNNDLSDAANLEIGGSWLWGHRSGDNADDLNLFGLDFTLLLPDRSGGFRNRLFQSEIFYGTVDNEDGQRQYPWGLYVLGQQQVGRDWYLGLRADWTQNPQDDSQYAWGLSPYASWYWNEYLRFRLQYSYKDGDVEEEHALLLQMTFVLGAHQPHPYWASR